MLQLLTFSHFPIFPFSHYPTTTTSSTTQTTSLVGIWMRILPVLGPERDTGGNRLRTIFRTMEPL
ncbi:hypothetical protein WG66_013353 [Moniliophthora roreri]|nr:hypothetical protein WG66_013353 [Moniliophthora roreri]